MLPCDLCLPQAHKKGIGENRTPKGRFNGCFVPWNLKCNQHDSTVYPSLSSNCLEWKTIGLTSLGNLVFQNCKLRFWVSKKGQRSNNMQFFREHDVLFLHFYMCKLSNLGGHHGSPWVTYFQSNLTRLVRKRAWKSSAVRGSAGCCRCGGFQDFKHGQHVDLTWFNHRNIGIYRSNMIKLADELWHIDIYEFRLWFNRGFTLSRFAQTIHGFWRNKCTAIHTFQQVLYYYTSTILKYT